MRKTSVSRERSLVKSWRPGEDGMKGRLRMGFGWEIYTGLLQSREIRFVPIDSPVFRSLVEDDALRQKTYLFVENELC